MARKTAARIPASLADLAVPIDSLIQFGRNPRRGSVLAIVESLRVNGQYRPVVVRSGTNEILAGNHTVLAARELGWDEIAATFLDCSAQQAARVVLVDNRSNDLATYDDVALTELLVSIRGLEGTGFTQADLDELLAANVAAPRLNDPDGDGRLGRGGPSWFGDNKQTTVFEVPKPPRSAEHPTMKPVALITAMLSNSVRPGGLVYEPFGGSGSTLMACLTLGMKARVVELDPKYCDVICRRYQEHTGVLPVLESTGVPVDFTAVAVPV
jgi:hypothetical protein